MKGNIQHIVRLGTAKIRGHRQLLLKFGIGLCLVVAGLQLTYPSDRALPFARVNGESVGFMTHEKLEQKLASEYMTGDAVLNIRGKKTPEKLVSTGINPNTDHVAKKVSEYPWYLRVVPLSIFFKGALTNQPVAIALDDEKFAQFATERQKECLVPAKDAGLVVAGDAVVLDPSKDGEHCEYKSLKQQVSAQTLQKSGLNMTVKTQVLKPVRNNASVEALLQPANQLVKRQLNITAFGKTYKPEPATIAGWLVFPEDPQTKKLTVAVGDDALHAYLETLQKEVSVAPGVTTVTTHDGIETGRVNGANGYGIDVVKTRESIKKQLSTGDGAVEVAQTVLAPTLRYTRSYSKTPAGLQALVNDLVAGKDMAISVRKLGDSGVHAQGDKQYHPASTYKLYVAYSVLKRVDAGQMNWAQGATGGQNVSQCFDNMVVNSDNACAEWFGVTIGWTTIGNEVRALGLQSTAMAKQFVTTANDLALFLQKLESNQLGVSEPSRARLIDAMKRQIYRAGIPKGVGVPVANKVGFLEGKLHDASIVYAPSGVYVMVIMSDGQSWGAIADVASKIHAQLAQ